MLELFSILFVIVFMHIMVINEYQTSHACFGFPILFYICFLIVFMHIMVINEYQKSHAYFGFPIMKILLDLPPNSVSQYCCQTVL